MDAAALHRDAVVFDGLNISRWSRAVFADMVAGGVTAANCTVCVWEGFADTMRNVGRFQGWFREHADLIAPVHTVADVHRAKADGRCGIVLGFQNVSGFEDRLDAIAQFKALGVGIVQMAYNTQNFVGTGCYESKDGGLSDFGREVVAEMNRVGIMCDLSHVGAVTSRDVITASKKPVCYSHCLPAGLKTHPRNKTDAELRFIAEHGGFVGVTMFPAFLRRGLHSTVDDYVEAIEYVIRLVGEDCVGIGTDFTQDQDAAFFEWLTHDKGYARRLTDFGPIVNPAGFRAIGDFPNLTDAMVRRGWGETRIRKVMGLNWLRVLGEVWGA